MTANHTPAPWTIEEYGDEDCPALVIHRDSETRVCFMATPGSHGDPAKIAADAALICAAPRMYELVKRVAEHFAGTDAPLGIEAFSILGQVQGDAARHSEG